MSSTQSQVAKLCIELDEKVREFGALEVDRANSEATYRAAKARRILQARADGSRSIADAEAVATADEAIEVAHREYLCAEAVSKACQQAILALRTRIDFGRSRIATERAGDTLHANGYGGSA